MNQPRHIMDILNLKWNSENMLSWGKGYVLSPQKTKGSGFIQGYEKSGLM